MGHRAVTGEHCKTVVSVSDSDTNARIQNWIVGFGILTAGIVLFAVLWDKRSEQVALKRRHTV